MRRSLERERRPHLKLVPGPRAANEQTRPAGRTNGRGDHSPGVREEKIALARRRVEQGYYDRADVLERVAEGILRYLRPAAATRTY